MLGRCIIGKHPNPTIENVDYVEGIAHNLLSIDQLCLISYKVIFFNNKVHILLNDEILFRGASLHNIYTISLGGPNNLKCPAASNEACWLWHRRISHACMDQITKLIRKNLVRAFPKIMFDKDKLCDACL